MIDHWLIDKCAKISTTRNRFGDIVYGESEQLACRFREINDLTRGTDNREELDSDGLFHFKAGSGVVLGDVLVYQGKYYRVDQIVKARKGGETNVQFIKCLVVRERQVS